MKLKLIGWGRINLLVDIENKQIVILINNVLHYPEIKINLLSIY